MNRHCGVILFFLTTVLTVTPLAASERGVVPPAKVYGDPTTNQDSVRQFLAAYREAWANQDTAALMALHSKDTEWINAYARIFRGRDELGKFIEQRLFPNFDPQVSRDEMANLKLISTRYLGDDAAILHLFTNSRRGASRNPEDELRKTYFHLVLVKQADDWRIVHTAIMDARG